MPKRKPRPRHPTPSSTYTNHYDQATDRLFFANVENRAKTTGYRPTSLEIDLAERCVEIMRTPRHRRTDNVGAIAERHIEDPARQIQFMRYVISKLYEARVSMFTPERRDRGHLYRRTDLYARER